MSWHTPERDSQASMALVCTPVTPGRYSSSSRIAHRIWPAASDGGRWPMLSLASSTSSAAGSVTEVGTRYSHIRSASAGERSTSQSTPGTGRGVVTSTRDSARTTSASCAVSTSKGVTVVPQ